MPFCILVMFFFFSIVALSILSSRKLSVINTHTSKKEHLTEHRNKLQYALLRRCVALFYHYLP